MVAVYNTFGDVESLRTERSKAATAGYFKPAIAAFVLLAVATVLLAGYGDDDTVILLDNGFGQRLQMLDTHPGTPEKNVFEDSDPTLDPSMKYKYDLKDEGDFSLINIASKVDGSTVEEGIPDPYADQSARTEVPDAVYSQPPPYDPKVVQLGEQTLGRPFSEYTIADEGPIVMGKDYVDTKFDKTLQSVPEINPARDWDFLSTDTEGGTLPKGY